MQDLWIWSQVFATFIDLYQHAYEFELKSHDYYYLIISEHSFDLENLQSFFFSIDLSVNE